MGRGRRKPERCFGANFGFVTFSQQWSNLFDQHAARIGLGPAIQMLKRVEADNDVPQVVAICRANHVRPEMTGKFSRYRHDFPQPLLIPLRLLR